MEVKADSNKVMDRLVVKIAQLEKQNAILQVMLEEKNDTKKDK